MRTIVVFHVPGDLWYCELGDLAGKPVAGGGYVHRGQAYRVIDVTESLGRFVKTDDGERLKTGNDRLLEILRTLFDEHEALGLFAKLNNIGSGDAETKTQGGVIVPGPALGNNFDYVVFARLKPQGKPVPDVKLATFIQQAFAIQSVDGDQAPESDDAPSTAGSTGISAVTGNE